MNQQTEDKFILLTAQRIDLTSEAHPELDMFIAANCFCMLESSADVQHTGPF